MTVKKIVAWECQECYNIFKTKKKAEKCCGNKIKLYLCNICKGICFDKRDSEECERLHEFLQDKWWQKYQDNESRLKLMQAGQARTQKKLVMNNETRKS